MLCNILGTKQKILVALTPIITTYGCGLIVVHVILTVKGITFSNEIWQLGQKYNIFILIWAGLTLFDLHSGALILYMYLGIVLFLGNFCRLPHIYKVFFMLLLAILSMMFSSWVTMQNAHTYIYLDKECHVPLNTLLTMLGDVQLNDVNN